MVHNFESGKTITAHDYQEIVDNLNTIYGIGTGTSGYGGVSSPAADFPSTVSGVIQNEDWLALRQAFIDTADHQNTVLTDPMPLITNLQNDDLIGFSASAAPLFDNFNSAANIALLTANAQNHGGETYTGPTQLGISTRATSWTDVLIYEFSLTFNNDDNEARAFFNTGGDIRLAANRTDGSATPQNAAWDSLLATVPPPFIGTDYFNLTTSYVEFFSVEDTSGGPYDIPNPIKWTIVAKTNAIGGINGGNGYKITFQMQFLDQHSTIPDAVDGIFTSAVYDSRADGTFIKPSPTYVLITALTAGI